MSGTNCQRHMPAHWIIDNQQEGCCKHHDCGKCKLDGQDCLQLGYYDFEPGYLKAVDTYHGLEPVKMEEKRERGQRAMYRRWGDKTKVRG